MNRGYYVDDIIPKVVSLMPARLRNHPYLCEYYGTVEWSIRGIFESYLGWFSGDPSHLFPLNNIQKGRRLNSFLSTFYDRKSHLSNTQDDKEVVAEMLKDQLKIDQAEWSQEQCQFVLEMSTWLLAAEKGAHEDGVDSHLKFILCQNTNTNITKMTALQKKLHQIKFDSLLCLSRFMISTNARNYYLSSAHEMKLSGFFFLFVCLFEKRGAYKNLRDMAIFASKVADIFFMGRTRFKGDEYMGLNITYTIAIHDQHSVFSLELRDGVMEVHEFIYPLNADIQDYKNWNSDDPLLHEIQQVLDTSKLVVSMSANTWRELAISESFLEKLTTFVTGDVKVIKGSKLDFAQIGKLFER
ncbi:hypothetical protein RFI_00972 [Reticulomyxa filosa]|uniref:Alkyl sulfatase dimerisation domain-containing protein n=1 Tax=Reticulomyxa filosa TaxID=46433 RepID=X6PEG4_RETFI|nr:hypothetical protein RFI_00972 [Reticulomyxa filosa]|eukprot:ETO36087.1 hypothetical protein RFI_00972 [Reticulomyxa filosa]